MINNKTEGIHFMMSVFKKPLHEEYQLFKYICYLKLDVIYLIYSFKIKFLINNSIVVLFVCFRAVENEPTSFLQLVKSIL